MPDWKRIATDLAEQLAMYDKTSHVHQATVHRLGYKRTDALEAFFNALREEP